MSRGWGVQEHRHLTWFFFWFFFVLALFSATMHTVIAPNSKHWFTAFFLPPTTSIIGYDIGSAAFNWAFHRNSSGDTFLTGNSNYIRPFFSYGSSHCWRQHKSNKTRILRIETDPPHLPSPTNLTLGGRAWYLHGRMSASTLCCFFRGLSYK